MTKRFILLVMLATNWLAADTITSGLILAQAGGGNPPSFYGLAGPTVDFRLSSNATGGPSPSPVEIVPECNSDGCFAFFPVFGFDFSTTLTSMLTSLSYNGIVYDLTQPFSFTLNLNAVAQGLANPALGPGQVFGTAYSYGASHTGFPVPFTLTGDATFIWNGQTIFTNLALDGSGIANASTSSVAGPLGTSTVSNMVYELGTTVDTPEPTAASVLLTGLLGAAFAIHRRKKLPR